jgi:hypothetical protein
MLTISTRERLRLAPARNAAELAAKPNFAAIHRRCAAMVASYANSIHVLVTDMQPDSEALVRGTERLRAAQDAVAATVGHWDEDDNGSVVDEQEAEIIFDEIDDIYR